MSETNRPKPKQGKESFLRGMPWLSFSYFSNSATAYYHACKWKYALTHVCVRTCGRRATSNFPFFFGSFWLFLLSLSVFPREQKPKMEKREREGARDGKIIFLVLQRRKKIYELASCSFLSPPPHLSCTNGTTHSCPPKKEEKATEEVRMETTTGPDSYSFVCGKFRTVSLSPNILFGGRMDVSESHLSWSEKGRKKKTKLTRFVTDSNEERQI